MLRNEDLIELIIKISDKKELFVNTYSLYQQSSFGARPGMIVAENGWDLAGNFRKISKNANETCFESSFLAFLPT